MELRINKLINFRLNKHVKKNNELKDGLEVKSLSKLARKITIYNQT